MLNTYCVPDPELVNCQGYKDEPDTVLADQLESQTDTQEPHWKCRGRRKYTACGHMRRMISSAEGSEEVFLEKVIHPEFTG